MFVFSASDFIINFLWPVAVTTHVLKLMGVAQITHYMVDPATQIVRLPATDQSHAIISISYFTWVQDIVNVVKLLIMNMKMK